MSRAIRHFFACSTGFFEPTPCPTRGFKKNSKRKKKLVNFQIDLQRLPDTNYLIFPGRRLIASTYDVRAAQAMFGVEGEIVEAYFRTISVPLVFH